MGSLSPLHWLIVLVVLVLLFGAKRLPDAARSLGQSLRLLKAETRKLNEDDSEAAQQPAPAPAPALLSAAAPLTLEEQARRLEEEAARLRAQAPEKAQDGPASP
jgi:sec-independent protein translocase protein TatA